MEQLKDVHHSLNDVRTTIYSIQEEYKTISHLENTLSELRKEATKHKQLKSAKENVKNILNIDDLAIQANAYIEQNKLLNAHKCLLDMEKCRNDILEELASENDKSCNKADAQVPFYPLLSKIIHNFMNIARFFSSWTSFSKRWKKSVFCCIITFSWQ